jgi:polyhydroxyalkanoate synthase
MSTSYNAYLYGIRLMNIYNAIYLRAFQKTVEEEREEVIEATMGGGSKGTIADNLMESIYNRWLKNVDDELEVELKSEHFTSVLSKYTQSLLDLRALFGKAGYPIEYFDRIFDWYVRSHLALSLIPKESQMAGYEVVHKRGKSRLLHYLGTGQESKTEKKQPLLIIYAPINTFHILDLETRRSVIRDLLESGSLDVYLLDWGYPDWSDNNLSLSDYVGYINDAVNMIKVQTNEAKISILGYCWGGILALIHASLRPENLRNLVLMAVPVDFSKDDTMLANWSRVVDVDRMMDEFGHMDGQVLNLGFIMRNPTRYGFDKYLKFTQRSHDQEFVETFIAVERWLYDTPPIPGALHRQIINDCYRNNLMIFGKMQVIENNIKREIELKKISVPTLSIIAEKDDLVSPASSLAVNEHISSLDKAVLMNPGGHVALCISRTAHEKLWPTVAKWLTSR